MSIDAQVASALQKWAREATKPTTTVEFGSLQSTMFGKGRWKSNGKSMTGWVLYSQHRGTLGRNERSTNVLFLDKSGIPWDLAPVWKGNALAGYAVASEPRFAFVHVGQYCWTDPSDRDYYERYDPSAPREWHYVSMEPSYADDSPPKWVRLSQLWHP